MNFSIPTELEALCDRTRQFIQDEVIPLEALETEQGFPDAHLIPLRQKARQAGLWTPQLPTDLGGLGLSMLDLCFIFEEAGRSPIGPIALNCAAPDEGNMHLLHQSGTDAQKKKYLQPLAQGEQRSCFAMTEPAPGAGSDPTMMRTTALNRGDTWIINGHKWFTTGAMGAAFAIVAAVTAPDATARESVTLFLVDAGTPGFEVVRSIPVMGTEGPGGHCEVKLTNCEVGESQILGGINQGFGLMQARLGPARLTHCMRWIGAAQRCMETAIERAQERQAFGRRLAEHQSIQWMLADSATDLHASRCMTYQAAWKVAQGDRAKQETSMCKVFVAEAIGRVIDRAVQICGSLGYSGDMILERMYRDARAFRIYDGPSEVHRMVIARQLLKPTK